MHGNGVGPPRPAPHRTDEASLIMSLSGPVLSAAGAAGL